MQAGCTSSFCARLALRSESRSSACRWMTSRRDAISVAASGLAADTTGQCPCTPSHNENDTYSLPRAARSGLRVRHVVSSLQGRM